jgi:uncharacterized protein YndB with AHSA1/START domain
MTERHQDRRAISPVPHRIGPPVAALLLAAGIGQISHEAAAEVTAVGPGGFEVRELMHVAAPPAAVYAALITPARWWDSQHSYSGKAANLTLDAKAGGCWCERLTDGGSALHLTVVYAAPGKGLRLRGALGPLQAMGVEGAMSFSLKAGNDGTDLTVTYAVGGYAKDGFDNLSRAVDGVLGEQVARLHRLIETGAPESATH